MNLKFSFNVSISFLAGISSLSAQEERPLEMVQLVYEVFSLEEKKAVATQRTNRTDIAVYQEMVTGLTNGEVEQEKGKKKRVWFAFVTATLMGVEK